MTFLGLFYYDVNLIGLILSMDGSLGPGHSQPSPKYSVHVLLIINLDLIKLNNRTMME